MKSRFSGKYQPGHRFAEGEHRARWIPENLDFILEQVRDVEGFVHPPYEDNAQVATAFSLAHKGVSTVILGARGPDQVARNMRTNALPTLAPDTVAAIKARFGQITELCNTK